MQKIRPTINTFSNNSFIGLQHLAQTFLVFEYVANDNVNINNLSNLFLTKLVNRTRERSYLSINDSVTRQGDFKT